MAPPLTIHIIYLIITKTIYFSSEKEIAPSCRSKTVNLGIVIFAVSQWENWECDLQMIKNMTIYVILKLEYGKGQENVYSSILNVSSSKSTAETFKEHYEEQFADEIQNEHDGRFVSIHMHKALVQLDDEIIAPDMFIRFIGDKKIKDTF